MVVLFDLPTDKIHIIESKGRLACFNPNLVTSVEATTEVTRFGLKQTFHLYSDRDTADMQYIPKSQASIHDNILECFPD